MIHPVDSVIHPLHNCGLSYSFVGWVSPALKTPYGKWCVKYVLYCTILVQYLYLTRTLPETTC